MCIESDANAKFGNEIIEGDPHNISVNGKLLLDIIREFNLIIVNSTEKCTGLITRIQKTKKKDTNEINIEKSVIDFFIVCEDFYNSIIDMKIDEDRLHVLINYDTL